MAEVAETVDNTSEQKGEFFIHADDVVVDINAGFLAEAFVIDAVVTEWLMDFQVNGFNLKAKRALGLKLMSYRVLNFSGFLHSQLFDLATLNSQHTLAIQFPL